MRQLNLRSAPRITPRYWTAIMLASMCGTNLGDFFPDILKIGAGIEMAALALIFAVLRTSEVLLPQKREAVYWMTILVVRAAATAISDFLIDVHHFGFVVTGARFAVLFAALLAIPYVSWPSKADNPLPDAIYWFTMLVAGTLGTILGDGLGHSFGPVQIGVPVSAVLATAALAAILWSKRGRSWTYGTHYWIAIVAVRWWGTNMGDIFKYLTTLPASLTVTGLGMATVLFLWRDGNEERGSALRE